MDVDDPPAPFADEPGREDAHEAGERDGPDAVVFERLAERLVPLLLVDALAVPGPGRKAEGARPIEAGRLRLVGGDQHDIVSLRLFDQRAHIASAARDQDCDAFRVTHYG